MVNFERTSPSSAKCFVFQFSRKRPFLAIFGSCLKNCRWKLQVDPKIEFLIAFRIKRYMLYVSLILWNISGTLFPWFRRNFRDFGREQNSRHTRGAPWSYRYTIENRNIWHSTVRTIKKHWGINRMGVPPLHKKSQKPSLLICFILFEASPYRPLGVRNI